jgi:outer membrane protein assembly factor BamB
VNGKTLIVFLLLLLVSIKFNLVLSGDEQASNSSQFHGDERHNGFIASVGPTTPLLAWKINQKADGMIASGGRLLVVDVYVNNNFYGRTVDFAHIRVLNETNGNKLGDIEKGTGLLTRYSAIGAGKIFSIIWIDRYGEPWAYGITVIDLFSFEEKWTKEFERLGHFGDAYYSIQVPYNKLLLAYSKGKLFEAHTYMSDSKPNGIIRAYLASSGAILWEVEFKNGTIATIPTVADDVVVIGFLDNPKITALSVDDGKILWNFTMDSSIISTPAYSSGYFYFGSVNGTIYAVSKDGEELWHVKLGSTVETTPAVAFGKVFVGADDGNLYALNATSGKVLWKYSTGGPIMASPIVSINGIVYVGSTDGYIYALYAETGDLVWSDNVGASIEVTPVLDNGLLFVASSDGALRAYGKPSFISVAPNWKQPSPPRNLTARGGVGYILLTWDPPSFTGAPDNSSGPLIYNVFRGTEPGHESFLVQVEETSYTDSSITPGITYYYVVTAINPAGSSDLSNEVSAEAPIVSPPPAVTNLTATIVGDVIRLTWTPPSYTGGLPITEYIIYRGVDPSLLSIYETVPGNTTSFDDTNYEPGTTYYYRVQAVNAKGKGELSSTVSIVAPQSISSWIARFISWLKSPEGIGGLILAPVVSAAATIIWRHVKRESKREKAK